MDFWKSQEEHKTRSRLLTVGFVLLVVAVAALGEWALRFFAADEYHPPLPYFAILFGGMTLLVSSFQYMNFALHGGSAVAESVGGVLAQQKQLLNIVAEVALAAGVETPQVYVIESPSINAFAAGLTPHKAAIAVTTGALQQLNRDELQGVIAHEMSHVVNGDMSLSTKVAALVMGFFFIFYFGIRALSGLSTNRNRKAGANLFVVGGLLLVVAGAVSWLFGSILKSALSRQREFLADATAVQFTRDPNGLAGALRKIQASTRRGVPLKDAAYAHLFFDDTSSLFATHPPLQERIDRLVGSGR